MTARRGVHAVVVRRVVDSAGSTRVLLQLPDGFMLVWPADARLIAGMLVEVADEIEQNP